MSEDDFTYHEQRLGGAATPAPAIPRFHTQTVHMTALSEKEGRPIYEEREFVEIIIPGDRRSRANEPVNDEHKARWPREYEAFRAGREVPLEGTPLANWPRVTRARVEELAYFNIRTVEQLAGVNDAQVQQMGMGTRTDREVARKFLETARTGTGPLTQMVTRIEELTREGDRKDQIIADQAAMIAALRDKETTHAGASA